MKFGYVCAPTGLQLAGGGIHVTENDLTGPEVTGSDPEVTSFGGSQLEVAVEGLVVKFWVHLSSYMAVTHRRWQSRDRK